MSSEESRRELTLYRCPHCTVEWAGPDVDDDRICECHHAVSLDDTKWRLKPVGTVEVESDGWTRLGPAVETLQKGYAVLYENEHRYKQKWGGELQDLTTDDEPVPGQIIGIEETRYGPRYEISPEIEWWAPERGVEDDRAAPVDTVWHWEIVEVTERIRASVRLEEIRQSVGDSDD